MKEKNNEMQNKLERQFLHAYDAHADAIYRHCYFRISSAQAAEDLMQEVFSKTWKYIADGGEVKNIKAFLYRVANNLLIDEYRKKNTTSLDAMHEAGVQHKDEKAENIEQTVDAKLAIQHIESLKEEYRSVVVMRYVDGLKVKEIAEALEESQNVVSVRLHRALKQLQENIKNHNDKK